MFSKQFREKHVLGIVLLFFLAFSFYWSMVQIVNAITCQDLVESLSLLSRGNGLTEGNKFQISDILVVSASAKEGDSYLLSFYNQTSLILSKSGEIYGNKIEVEVPLYPPKFKAKQNYIVHLQVFVNDCVLPGVTISSPPKVSFFSLASTSTKLMLEKAYDETNHELKLNAILLNDLNLPIANRTVNFYLQFNSNSSLPNIGWAFIAAAETNNEGTASLNMGCNVISGHHKLRASFEGNEDFESSCDEAYFTSENYVPIVNFVEATSHNETVTLETEITDKMGRPLFGKLFTLDFGCGDEDFVCGFTDETGHVTVCFPKPQILQESVRLNYSVGADVFTSKLSGQLELNFSDGESLGLARFGQSVPTAAVKRKIFNAFSNGYGLNVTIEPVTPYATLPCHVRAFYVSDVLYDGLEFSFFLDGAYKLAVMNVSKPKQLMENSYLYEAWMVWCPDIVGSHFVGVTVKNLNSGFGVESVLAEGSVGFMSQPAPSNLVVYHPQAVYGVSLKIGAAFSGPRLYEPVSSDLFYSVLLAPHVVIDGKEHVIDDGVSSVVHFYIDGVHVVRPTDESGLAYLYWPFSDEQEHKILNITAVAESGLYQEKRVCQVLNLTKVHVQDSSFGGDEFMLDFSVCSPDGSRQYTLQDRSWKTTTFSKSQPMYVGVESLVKVETRLFNLSLFNAPVWVTAAWLFKFGTTDSAGHAVVPDDPLKIAGDPSGRPANYLHLVYLYNLQYTGSARVDVNRDGKIDMKDIGTAAKAFGSWGPNGPVGSGLYGDPAHPRWNPLADIEGDNYINMKDVGAIARRFGDEWPFSLDFSNVSVHFHGFGNFNVDSQGFVKIPSGVSEFTVLLNGQPIGATLDFGRIEFENYCVTNKVGLGEVTWAPSNFGFANYPRTFHVIHAKISSDFVSVVTAWMPITSVNACLTVFRYAEVELRPSDVSLSHLPFEIVSVNLLPSDDAYVDSSEPHKNFNEDKLKVKCSNTMNDVARTFLKFDLSFIPYGSFIWNASLWIYHGWSGGYECAPVDFDVCAVLSDFGREYWQEGTIRWNNAPTRFSSPVSTRTYKNHGWHGDYGWWVFDLTETVHNWTNWYQANYGLVVKFRDEKRYDIGEPYVDIVQFASKEYSDPGIRPFLHVEYIPEPTLVAECRDLGSGEPLAGIEVKFVIEGPSFKYECSNVTNLEGVAYEKVWFGGHCLFNVSASVSGGDDWLGDKDVLFVDFRMPCMFLLWVNGVSVGNNSQVNVDVGYENQFKLELWPPQFWNEYLEILQYYPPSEPWFLVYVNGTYDYGLSMSATYGSFSWTANQRGVTFFRLESIFAVEAWATASFCFSVNALAVPVALEFSVSPSDFEAGTNVLLKCRVIDVRSGNPVPSGFKVRFFIDETFYIGFTDSNGVATRNYVYPTSGVHTFRVETDPSQTENRRFASSTVMLNVGVETRLFLDFSRDHTSIRHCLSGWLRKADGTPLPGKRVTLKVNGTLYDDFPVTDANGCFWRYIDLESVQDLPTRYEITANYTEASQYVGTASAYGYLADGTKYEVCRTIQYNLRPALNTSVLIVSPQSSCWLGAKKTIEEMQEQAKNNGWLSIWHEWSWFYPWWRMHIKININPPTIDIGFNPILLGGETFDFRGIEVFANIAENVLEDVILDIVAIFGQYIVAKGLSLWNPAAGIFMESIKFLIQMGLLVWREWNNKAGLLVSALVSFVMGIIALVIDFGLLFIKAILRLIAASTANILSLLYNKLVVVLMSARFIQRWWIDALESTFDWITGGFAMARYLGWI